MKLSLKIDRGGGLNAVRCAHSHGFTVILFVIVYYTYLDRLDFSLSNISHFDQLEIKEFMNQK